MQIKDKNLYYVGGVVRDEILGLESLDTDFCYEGNAIEFAQGMNITKTNLDFGTVRVETSFGEIDIASTRTEIYPKAGHLPIIEKIGCSLVEDLKRRDFTINAMAKNTLTGEIIDQFNGLEDIKNKKIRVLHNDSFIEDPSRIIRALKFSVRFGFELEQNTKKLQDEYLENINYDLSFHRLKKELKETFNLNRWEAITIFIEQKIYRLLGKNQVKPQIKYDISKLIEKYSPNHIYMVYLGLFDLSNFELTSEESDIINGYRKINNQTPKNDIETYNLFSQVPLESILLYAATVNSDSVINYLENLANIKININGNDLIKLGFKQGKIFNDIFEYIRAEKIKNPSLTKDDEIKIVKEEFYD